MNTNIIYYIIKYIYYNLIFIISTIPISIVGRVNLKKKKMVLINCIRIFTLKLTFHSR